jgi:hypothetical protein
MHVRLDKTGKNKAVSDIDHLVCSSTFLLKIRAHGGYGTALHQNVSPQYISTLVHGENGSALKQQ